MALYDIKGRDALSATAYGGSIGSADWNQAAWNVNVAGSGTAAQSATSSAIPTWMIVAAVVGGAWLLLRRK